MSWVQELQNFLQSDNRNDLKSVALEHVLGLTGHEEGVLILTENSEILISVISILNDKKVNSKNAALSLVNISANEVSAKALVNLKTNRQEKFPENIIDTMMKFICDPQSEIADPCCMILSNLSRPLECVEKIVDQMQESGHTIGEIASIFANIGYNKNGANLDYLGMFICNLSRNAKVLNYILERDGHVLQKLLPFTDCRHSSIRRSGIIGTLKHCCFETLHHEWLLSDEVDILPRLLLPLAGNTEYDEDDNDKLPVELQYLPEDKMKDEDPDIRCTLLEAITQLCTLRKHREYIRGKNVYVILRDLHKWESNVKCQLACENLVDILIRTEEEIGIDNIKEVEVPDEFSGKFNQVDQQILQT